MLHKPISFGDGKPPLNVSPEQLALLVEEGAVREGTIFYVAQVDRAKAEALINQPDVMRCDFCSIIPCVVTFVTGDYMAVHGHVSLEGFSACEECAKLVRERDEDAVYLRSIKLLSAKTRVKEIISAGGAPAFEDAVRDTQRQFFNHWQGKEVAL